MKFRWLIFFIIIIFSFTGWATTDKQSTQKTPELKLVTTPDLTKKVTPKNNSKLSTHTTQSFPKTKQDAFGKKTNSPDLETKIFQEPSGEENNLRVAKATEWNAYATIAIAILTILLAAETVRLRLIQARQIKNLNEAAIKPKVEIFLESNKYAINFIEIHLVNNGNGTANNIKFSFEAANNEAIETSKYIISKIENINFFNTGLKYLGAGQVKKSFLMSAIENELGGNETFFKSTIFIKITCEDDLGKEYLYKYTLNMAEFQGITSIGSEPAKEIADNVKKISDSLASVISFSSGKKRLQTDTYSDSSRKTEKKRKT